jgi:surfactin synthase thioesterase subunit
MEAFQGHGVLFSQGAPLAELQALVEVYRASWLGHETYRLEGRLQAPIHLFQARERGGSDSLMDHRPVWGWQEGSEQSVFLYDVPGTHITMMASPQVEVLAEQLQSIFKASLTRRDGPRAHQGLEEHLAFEGSGPIRF